MYCRMSSCQKNFRASNLLTSSPRLENILYKINLLSVLTPWLPVIHLKIFFHLRPNLRVPVFHRFLHWYSAIISSVYHQSYMRCTACIFLLFNLNCRGQIGFLRNAELERIWKESVVVPLGFYSACRWKEWDNSRKFSVSLARVLAEVQTGHLP
jgi:hypothetical protein